MPYNYTHALLAVASSRKFTEAGACIISAYPEVFLIGSLGPDPYFGDALPRPLFRPCREELADRLHKTDGALLFSTLVKLAGTNGIRQAYVLGFACHFLLDWTAHPYIYARFPGKMHSPSEIAMDLMMVKRLGAESFTKPPSQVYRTTHLEELDELHRELNGTLYHISDPGAFARSYKKWIWINTLSFDPKGCKCRGLKKRFPGVAEYLVTPQPLGERDWLNLECRPWKEGEARRDSFPALFDQATELAAGACNDLVIAMNGGNVAPALTRFQGRNMNAEPLV